MLNYVRLSTHAVLCIAGLVSATAVFSQNKMEMYQGKPVLSNQVLVKYKRSISATSMRTMLIGENIDKAQAIGGINVQKLSSRTKSTADLIASLKKRSDIEYVEPDYIVKANATPNDPQFDLLWGLQNTGQLIRGNPGVIGADIKAVPAWNVSTGSRATVVGIVDSGVDYNHRDLAPNMWKAPTAFTVTIGGTTINCAAGSYGFNSITKTCDSMDDNGHGTHVAGSIGAAGNNGEGIVGVNWTTSMLGLKFLGSDGYGTLSGAIDAIEFAIQVKARFGDRANIRVLSNSWGESDFSQALLDQINRANANGILFVVAAGNKSFNNDEVPDYPSNYKAPNLISVAALSNQSLFAIFSNYGPSTVHLGAPGVGIYSTLPNNKYGYLSGTSMAVPQVSGAAALILSKCNLNTSDLKSLILKTVDPVPALAGMVITGGRLNINTAITSCSTAPVNPVNPVDPSSSYCPPGSQADQALGFCADRRMDNAYGPFTKKMTDDCVRFGGGPACSEKMRFQIGGRAVDIPRWSLKFTVNLRGSNTCMNGAVRDTRYPGFCVEEASQSQSGVREVYGPFPAAMINRCLANNGGDACYSNRWSYTYFDAMMR
jgi:subtilisin family serine protease